MKLPILNQVKYLSPSSFEEWSRCQMAFYLKRMTGLIWPSSTQSVAAAVGSAFDAYVKAEIAVRLGLGSDPRYDVAALLKSSVEPFNHGPAIPLGKVLFEHYVRAKRLDKLMAEGLTSIELSHQVDLKVNDTLVPVLGKPDAAIQPATPIDWKVQGATSKSGASPAPGYHDGRRGFDTLPPHKRCGEPLEALEPRWARQLAIYTWLYTGVLPWRVIPAAIENITIRGGTYTFTSIRTHISVEFQQKLWADMARAWEDISNGEIQPAMPSQERCYPYFSRCEVADRCESFLAWEKRQQAGGSLTDKIMGR